MSFCARNFGAFLLAQVIVGLMFAAIFTDWYSWTTNYTQKGGTVNSNALQGVTNTLTLNYSNIYFNTTGFRTIIRTSAQTTANVAAVTVYSTWGNTNGAYSKVRLYDLSRAFASRSHSCAGGLIFQSGAGFLHHRPHHRRLPLLQPSAPIFFSLSKLLHQSMRNVHPALAALRTCVRHLGVQRHLTPWFSWCHCRVFFRSHFDL